MKENVMPMADGESGKGRMRLLDIQQAACFLGLKPRTIYNRIGPRSTNPFPVKPRRIGRKVLFDIRELEAFVNTL
jgi:predicted DNA-binding transcriptional regulator AlpA